MIMDEEIFLKEYEIKMKELIKEGKTGFGVICYSLTKKHDILQRYLRIGEKMLEMDQIMKKEASAMDKASMRSLTVLVDIREYILYTENRHLKEVKEVSDMVAIYPVKCDTEVVKNLEGSDLMTLNDIKRDWKKYSKKKEKFIAFLKKVTDTYRKRLHGTKSVLEGVGMRKAESQTTIKAKTEELTKKCEGLVQKLNGIAGKELITK